jgi:hypothetical protein
MNYQFWWDGKPFAREDLFIGTVFFDEWTRPQLGQEISIKGKSLKITRIDPPSNPAGQSVKYFVEVLNSNWPYKAKKD